MDEKKKEKSLSLFEMFGLFILFLVVWCFVPVPCPMCGARGSWKTVTTTGKPYTDHCSFCHGTGKMTLITFLNPCR